MRTDMRTMKHFFMGLVVCFLVFSGTMFGLMWVSIELTKDFHPEDNGILKTPDGQAIANWQQAISDVRYAICNMLYAMFNYILINGYIHIYISYTYMYWHMHIYIYIYTHAYKHT